MRISIRPALFLLLALLAAASGCGTLTPAPTPPPTSPPPTSPPSPSPPPPPTATRPPTATSRPTAVATATALSSPVPTAEPTATPRPTRAVTLPPAASATPEVILTSLKDLSSLAGQEVTVQGTVIGVTSFSQGFDFTLDDGTGRAILVMWLNVYDNCWDASKLMVGAQVRARGKVSQYKDQWQVEAGYGGDVKVLSVGAPPQLRPIGTIANGDVGAWVAIEGTVSKAEAFSGGQRVYVSDSSGTMMVLLWQNVFDRVKDNARLVTPGTLVWVAGVVDDYKGTLEVAPPLPSGVVVR